VPLVEIFPPASVWFVGAGPGDPDLLTRKAEKLIRRADVIFYDALVGQGVLNLAPDVALMVSVGKRARRHSKDQNSINRLLVQAAARGKRVLRLKGGDPAIFGRLQEEMDALNANAIPFRICPGITAASAAAAAAGNSLTLRGLARKLTFITAHARAGEELQLDWNSLNDPNATLAIYMGKSAAGALAVRLQQAGLAADTPVLLVENASLPNERILNSCLSSLDLVMKTSGGNGPVVMLVGKAVAVSALDLRNDMPHYQYQAGSGRMI